MSYLVMECHPAYVVVLDEEGRFLKAANLGYQVGQSLTEIIPQERQTEVTQKQQKSRHWAAVVTAAACLCLVFLSAWNVAFAAYGTVRIQINPDVVLTVNRLDYVIGAKGMNVDGDELLKDWNYRFLKTEEASGQLTRRAEDLGYLGKMGAVHVGVDSQHDQWRNRLEQRLVTALEASTPPDVRIIPSLCDDDAPPVWLDREEPEDREDDAWGDETQIDREHDEVDDDALDDDDWEESDEDTDDDELEDHLEEAEEDDDSEDEFIDADEEDDREEDELQEDRSDDEDDELDDGDDHDEDNEDDEDDDEDDEDEKGIDNEGDEE